MAINADKTNDNNTRSIANTLPKKQNFNNENLIATNNLPGENSQSEIQKMANDSPQVKKAAQLQSMVNHYVAQKKQNIIQKHHNDEMTTDLSSSFEKKTGTSFENETRQHSSEKPVQRVVVVNNKIVQGGIRAFVEPLRQLEFGDNIIQKLNEPEAKMEFEDKKNATERYKIGWDVSSQKIIYSPISDTEKTEVHTKAQGGDGGQQERTLQAAERALALDKAGLIQKLYPDKSQNSRVFEHSEFCTSMHVTDDESLKKVVGEELKRRKIDVDEKGDVTIEMGDNNTIMIAGDGKIYHFGPGK